MNPPDIYIPPSCRTLDSKEVGDQLRVGLQGMPKIGKTWAALSFPNPIVINFDRGLVAHTGRKDVVEVPFYLDSFVDSIVKRVAPSYRDHATGIEKVRPANRKDAILKWLYKEGTQLKPSQTLVIDGNTALQAAFHTQYWVDPAYDKDGKIKPYEEYNRKVSYFTEIAMCLKGLLCNVVYICHESDDRDSLGNKNGKIRPLMSGKFVDELQSHFTDWFRCHCFDKDEADLIKGTKCTKEQAQEWIAASKSESVYLWQTESDTLCTCGTSLVGAPKYILADHSSILKYSRKVA